MQCEILCMARRTFLRRVHEGRCAAVLGDEIALLSVGGSVRRALLGRPESLDGQCSDLVAYQAV
jgi:hypothetical protein